MKPIIVDTEDLIMFIYKSKLVKHINKLIKKANQSLSPADCRSGGYLTIMDAKTGTILAIIACGKIPEEKKALYLKFSQEKAQRLFEHLVVGHMTSYESKDDANEKYAGAICGSKYIISFSGHKADVDEAISISAFYMIEAHPHKNLGKVFTNHLTNVAPRNRFVKSFLNVTQSNTFLEKYDRLIAA